MPALSKSPRNSTRTINKSKIVNPTLHITRPTTPTEKTHHHINTQKTKQLLHGRPHHRRVDAGRTMKTVNAFMRKLVSYIFAYLTTIKTGLVKVLFQLFLDFLPHLPHLDHQ